MELDMVHDIQKVYRKVLNAMSRPGVIEDIKKQNEKVDIKIECYKSTFLLMLMLLDGEVSFALPGNKDNKIINIINQMTYSKEKKIGEADYLFVTEKGDINKAIKNGKIGNLIDPNKSSTIIVEVQYINDQKKLELSGPGIKESIYANIEGYEKWLKIRNEKNKEYPLGIDMIFLDKKGKVICLPRTTKIKDIREEKKWDM